MTSQPMTPQEAIESLGLTVESVFVAFSQSRNKDAKLEGFTVIKDMTKQKAPLYTLNWRVTHKRNGRVILITDSSAGIARPTKASKSVMTSPSRVLSALA